MLLEVIWLGNPVALLYATMNNIIIDLYGFPVSIER